MENKEFATSHAFVKLKKEDLDDLRRGIITEYQKMDGDKELGRASPLIYEELEGFFKTKFQQQSIDIYYTKNNEPYKIENPGVTFLKNLFYTNKAKPEMQSHQYNFDVCYVFAFGDTMKGIKARNRSQKKSGTQDNANDRKIILSAFSENGAEVEKLKKYFEGHFGYKVEKDIRDVSSLSVGSLIKFYSSIPANTIVVHLVSKYHFSSETSVVEFNHIRTKMKDQFLSNSRIVFLDDICSGDYNLSATAGRLKINEGWQKQIRYMEEQTPKKKGKLTKEEIATKKMLDASTKNIRGIISTMDGLVDFMHKENEVMPYNYFVNSSSKEEINKWLHK